MFHLCLPYLVNKLPREFVKTSDQRLQISCLHLWQPRLSQQPHHVLSQPFLPAALLRANLPRVR